MRFDLALVAATLFSTAGAGAIGGPRNDVRIDVAAQQDGHDLFKRRGGGGGGSRGGGSSGGSSSGGGSSGGGSSGGGARGGSNSGSSGSSSGSSGKGGSAGGSGSRGNTSPGSNSGSTSRGGSGPIPSFGGGRFYGGGSARPFRSGGTSPAGIVPFALAGAALGFWGGLWLHGAHLYPFNYVHRYHNDSSNRDESAKVLCGCAQFEECGCGENTDPAYYDGLIGNGSYAALNKSLINVGQFKGQKTLFINGTLPNGTTADGPDLDSSSVGCGMRSLVEAAGLLPAVAAVAAVFLA